MGGFGAISVQGRIIKAGQEVLVVANCKGFRFAGSTVESPVLNSDDLKVQQNFPEGPFFAMAKVRENTKPGTYPISFICWYEAVGPLRRRWRSAGTRGREAGQARQKAGQVGREGACRCAADRRRGDR
jgi:hypothetical protein